MFDKLHGYILHAYQTEGAPDEEAIMAGLRAIVHNTRDCFLVEQLVFLERQAEAANT